MKMTIKSIVIAESTMHKSLRIGYFSTIPPNKYKQIAKVNKTIISNVPKYYVEKLKGYLDKSIHTTPLRVIIWNLLRKNMIHLNQNNIHVRKYYLKLIINAWFRYLQQQKDGKVGKGKEIHCMFLRMKGQILWLIWRKLKPRKSILWWLCKIIIEMGIDFWITSFPHTISVILINQKIYSI